MSQASFNVQGMRPVPWACNEWAWRAAIAAHARLAVVGEVPPAATFAVHLVFRMTATNIGRADLDNLAKPVLDTIFRPRNSQVQDQTLTGALLSCDDDRVFRLELEKRQVQSESDEGCIYLSPGDVRLFAIGGELVVETMRRKP